MSIRRFIALTIAGSLTAGMAIAGQYIAPGLGTVTLDAPKQWRVKERPGPTSAYLEMRPEGEDGVTLQITAAWLPQDKIAETRGAIKDRVEGTAKGWLPNAVEKEAPLTALNGAGGTGYYFTLTARQSESGTAGPRYLTQGMLATNVGLTVFTLIQQDASAAQRQQVLDMLASASYSKDTDGSTIGPQDQTLRVVPQEASYQLWLPASRLYMHIPKGHLVPVPNAANGPRYFYFVDRGLNISGWFEPEKKFAGTKAFWEAETAAWKKNGLPEAVEVSFKQIGGWDTIIYDTAMATGANTHIRAHWHQAGTWIDLHLSMTANRSSAELRNALEVYLGAIVVKERPSAQ